jgi:hypothetical protein
MKRLRTFLFALALIALPTAGHAYIGAGLGAVDEDNFGFGLVFGAGLFANFGIDGQVVSYLKSEGTADVVWIQGNIDAYYDFNGFFSDGSFWKRFHPVVKGGFTYGAGFVDAGLSSGTEASHGPGFNVGAAFDFKIFDVLTVGLDLTESFIYLDGVTVGGVALGASETAKVFNIMALVKLFAY